MIFGPVFEFEARLSSRRRRTYATRALYGLAMLGFTALAYDTTRRMYGTFDDGRDSYRMLAEVGRRLFWDVITFQAFAVDALVPALVAGAIADDRRRGILVNLLASPLKSWEIVLGKLGARTLQVFMLFLVGLPIVCIVALMGGIEPKQAAGAFGATAGMIWFLASLSMLVSVHAKRPRDAIFFVYLLLFAWLIAPQLLRPVLTIWWTGLQPVFWPLLRALELSSPMAIGDLVNESGVGGRLLLLIAIELVGGAIFASIAIVRLRREGFETGLDRAGADEPARRPRRRPPVGDDPMLWRETKVARSGLIVRLGCWLIVLPLSLVLLEQTYEGARRAFEELLRHGYGWTSFDANGARQRFAGLVQSITPTLFVAWLLAVATTAANSVTSEKEEDTWLSLRSTPLDSAEIVRAKRRGALLRFRLLGAAILLMCLLAVAAGAVHVLALPLMLAEFSILSFYTAALGVFFSSVCRNSTQAVVATVAALVTPTVLSIGVGVMGLDKSWAMVGVVPLQLSTLMLSEEGFQILMGRLNPAVGSRLATELKDTFPMAIFGMFLHGLAAFALVLNDDHLDDVERPRREAAGSLRPQEEFGEGTDGEVRLDEAGRAVEHG